MRATILITEDGTAVIGEDELHPTKAGESRNPYIVGSKRTLEYVISELLGPTILILNDQGNPLYAVNVSRPGMYVCDENGHTYADIPVPARPLATA